MNKASKKSDFYSNEEAILVSLRKIIRAIDLHSHKLAKKYKLTGPQVICLKYLQKYENSTPGQIADFMHVSQATVTGIIDRLESRNYVVRVRCKTDRRKVFIQLTEKGSLLAQNAPPPLQEIFARRLRQLPIEEQNVTRSVLEQIVVMMDAEEIEASPVLQIGSIVDDSLE